MISQISVQNVRIFEDKVWKFDFLPLTLFTGTNSSGKSTLLRTLLLLRQSQGIFENSYNGRGKVKFIGSQVDLGNYQSFVSNEDLSKDFKIGITIKDSLPEFLYKAFDSNLQKSQNKGTPKEFDYFLETDFTFTAKPTILQSRNEKRSINDDVDNQETIGVLKSLKFKFRDANKKLFTDWEVNYSENNKKIVYLIQFREKFFLQSYGELIPDLVSVLNLNLDQLRVNDDTGTNSFIKCNASLVGLLPSSLNLRDDVRGKRITLPLHPALEAVQNDLEHALQSIKYIAPLRAPAQRYYFTPLDINPPTDPTGESIPYIFKDLSQGIKHQISYIKPTSTKKVSDSSLLDAVNIWMHYVRTGDIKDFEDEVEFEKTKILVELKIRSPFSEKQHAMADSGFGYSQLFPIIIQGLDSPESSIIIIEQPELHLNPALQARLAEFFMALVLLGKQVIIETHSEHIVNMIRVLAAEDSTSELAKKICVYYIDNLGNIPKIHNLSISENGMIPNLPKDFFGETANLTARLLRAQKKYFPQH